MTTARPNEGGQPSLLEQTRRVLSFADDDGEASTGPASTADAPLDGALSLLSVAVKGVDPLVPQHQLTSPVVRVSIVDEETGQYLGHNNRHAARAVGAHNAAGVMETLSHRVPANVIAPAQTQPCDLSKLSFPKLAGESSQSSPRIRPYRSHTTRMG